uniref:Uncharacterized protein n=1 Tax=Eutreptiella gymnastica TaxID=73025 RepID=A0A7S4FSM2_9EUGL
MRTVHTHGDSIRPPEASPSPPPGDIVQAPGLQTQQEWAVGLFFQCEGSASPNATSRSDSGDLWLTGSLEREQEVVGCTRGMSRGQIGADTAPPSHSAYRRVATRSEERRLQGVRCGGCRAQSEGVTESQSCGQGR